MRYWPSGPWELKREGDLLLLFDPEQRREFWDEIDAYTDGLSSACGCYVFAIRAGKGIRPWYVGKAERQSFKRECLTDDKLRKYESALRSMKRGTPLLYFYARITDAKGHYSRPSTSKHRDVGYLEKMLIGLALKRNKCPSSEHLAQISALI